MREESPSHNYNPSTFRKRSAPSVLNPSGGLGLRLLCSAAGCECWSAGSCHPHHLHHQTELTLQSLVNCSLCHVIHMIVIGDKPRPLMNLLTLV